MGQNDLVICSDPGGPDPDDARAGIGITRSVMSTMVSSRSARGAFDRSTVQRACGADTSKRETDRYDIE